MLSFAEFQKINAQRCEEAFGHIPGGAEEWPLQNWALAIAGEAGELCNLVKKCLRGDFTIDSQRDAILAELADVITYADLAITHLKADTGQVVAGKFDEVSNRRGWVGARLTSSHCECHRHHPIPTPNYDTSVGQGCDECGNTHGDAHSANCTRGVAE